MRVDTITTTTRIIYKKQLKQLSRQSTSWRDKDNNAIRVDT